MCARGARRYESRKEAANAEKLSLKGSRGRYAIVDLWNDMAGPVGDAHFLDKYFDELSLKGQTPEYAPSV